MTTTKPPTPATLRTSPWLALDIALRRLDSLYGAVASQHGLTIAECYILMSLYKHDGQMASKLAHSIGRAPTSFTPTLDSLENKCLLARNDHAYDRRSTIITLTTDGLHSAEDVSRALGRLDEWLAAICGPEAFAAFLDVVSRLQEV